MGESEVSPSQFGFKEILQSPALQQVAIEISQFRLYKQTISDGYIVGHAGAMVLFGLLWLNVFTGVLIEIRSWGIATEFLVHPLFPKKGIINFLWKVSENLEWYLKDLEKKCHLKPLLEGTENSRFPKFFECSYNSCHSASTPLATYVKNSMVYIDSGTILSFGNLKLPYHTSAIYWKSWPKTPTLAPSIRKVMS